MNKKNTSKAIKEPNKQFYSGEELLGKNIQVIPKLLEPILPKVGVIALGGSSDTGKSTILRQLAMAIVSKEEDFLGFKLTPEHHSAIYLSTEDDEFDED